MKQKVINFVELRTSGDNNCNNIVKWYSLPHYLLFQVPIAALVLIVVLIVIMGYGVFLSGLNILAATMIKQLFSYLQVTYYNS